MKQKGVALEEVLASWRRCVCAGLISSQPIESTYVKPKASEYLSNESLLMQSVFEELFKGAGELFKRNNLLFFLTNNEGVLLKKSALGSQGEL